MKRNIQSFLAILSMAIVGSFVACSQDDEVTLRRPSGGAEQTVAEALSGTRGSDPVVCSVKTDMVGQVQSKVEEFVNGGGTTVVENITNLYIEGPINQADINYIKNLQYLDSLSLEKADVYDGDGKQTNVIGEKWFENMQSEAAVVLPKSVNTLDRYCFTNANIRAVYLDNITAYSTKNEWKTELGNGYTSDYGSQFYSCKRLKKVRFAENMTAIVGQLFTYCSALEQVELPSSVKTIGVNAFAGTGLTKITLPQNLVSVGHQAFRKCLELKEVLLPEIREIGDCVFTDCSNLVKVVWPQTIVSIPKYTFSGCVKLQFELPNHITSIGDYAFQSCQTITDLSVTESFESIGKGAFKSSGLTSLVKGLKFIPVECYAYCNGLTDIIIPEGATSIEKQAFYECSNIQSLKLPSHDCPIGSRAFYNCGSLTTVEIPICSSIGSYAFNYCKKLKNLAIAQCDEIQQQAFYHCEALTSLKLSEMSGEIGGYAFSNCSNLQEVEMGSCSRIGSNAFSGCKQLKRVSMGITEIIDNQAFYGCTSLEEFTMQEVKEIGQWAFEYCAFKGIFLREGLEKLGGEAFRNCSALRSIEIPSTVKVVGDGIFSNCKNLAYVKWNSSKITVPLLNSGNSNPNMLLYVPKGLSVDNRNRNVISGGHANLIQLQHSATPFYCPEAFTASEVIFEQNFGSSTWKNVTTGGGVAARWNTLTLPFTVTGIISDAKGALAPFGSEAQAAGTAKPFWLCEMTAGGWKDAVKIEANNPYIYAMPNNPNYSSEYNIQDLVTFSAKNVTIEKTPEQLQTSPTGPDGWALTPIFEPIAKQANLFTINWEPFTDRKGVQHPTGNCFRQNIRTANSFEAAILPPATTRAEYISLGSKATTRSARPLGKVPQREDMRLW